MWHECPLFRKLHEPGAPHDVYLRRLSDECRANHPNNASRTIANIKAFLHSPCTKPHAKPSWAEQSKQLFNCPPNILLEDMNLQEWYELTGTMAVLVPLAGKCAQ